MPKVLGKLSRPDFPAEDTAAAIVWQSHPVPATTNPLGVKGCGEAGCAGAMTSVMNAVVDALSAYGIRHFDMPASPVRVWEAIKNARHGENRGQTPQT